LCHVISHTSVNPIWAEFIFKQSRFAHARRCAAGLGKAGTAFPVTTGRIAEAWMRLWPLFTAFTARLGWSEADCKSNAVRAVVADAVAALSKIILTPLCVALDRSSSMNCADRRCRNGPDFFLDKFLPAIEC